MTDGVMTFSDKIPCPQCSSQNAIRIGRYDGVRKEVTHIYCDECGLRRNVEDETTQLIIDHIRLSTP